MGLCKFLDCKKNAVYCSEHKLPNMINVKSKKCQYPGCITRPSFNYEGQKNGIYCSEHKLPNMVDVVSKRCQYPGCKKCPSFNYEGQQDKIYCSEHKLPDMVDVKSKKCQYPGCKKRPSFNYEGQQDKIYCSEHKLPDMVDLKHKKCEYPGCKKHPSFNYEGQRIGIYCYEHKLPKMMDVKHKKCQFPDCKTRASYGKLFKSKIHCAKHKDNNEYEFNYPKCEIENCNEMPIYTDKNDNYPLRCEKHKKINDKNVIERPCKSCNLLFYLNEETQLCNDCHDYYIKKVYKAKENKKRKLLEANNIKIESYDSIIENSCSKYRPDFVIDYTLFKVILEVDENQHSSYSCECEYSRMVQVFQDFGGIPIIFIRFNPDEYRDENNKLIKSYTGRENKLLELLHSLSNIKELPYPFLITYLYYDGFNNNISFLAIDFINNVLIPIKI